MRLILIVFLIQIITACTPNIHPAGTVITLGEITEELYIAPDGAKLPLRSWKPIDKKPKAIIIAIHGFNDYSLFFKQPGEYFRQRNILSYAYDQRGFGETNTRGLWAGIDTYNADLAGFVRVVKNKHPKIPLYLLGESMGGAIIITAVTQKKPLPIEGIILLAPAVWPRDTMPWYQTTLLWALSHTVPWMTLTGSGLNIKPSDNIKMLRALGGDPLVIKETRVETLNGLTNLMDHAFYNASRLTTSTLLLYGEKDEIIPKEPTQQFLQKLNHSPQIAFYKNGYHMLLRDLQATILWKDINAWMSFPFLLPSGADKRAREVLNN